MAPKRSTTATRTPGRQMRSKGKQVSNLSKSIAKTVKKATEKQSKRQEKQEEPHDDQGDEGSESYDLGEKLKGRGNKLLSLSKQGKIAMLQDYADLGDLQECDVCDDWLTHAMIFVFHINKKTPLPGVKNVRFLEKLRRQAKFRVEDLQFKAVSAGTKLKYGERDSIRCYYVTPGKEEGQQLLHCGFLDETAELPRLSAGAEWEVDDVNCLAACVQNTSNRMVALDCVSFFPKAQVLLPEKQWAYSKPKPAETGGSPPASLSFKNFDFLALQDELAEIMFLVLRKFLKNEEKQAAARSFLKTVASTLEAVQAKGTLAAKQMLKGQHSPIGSWALDSLAKVEFQTTPAEVFHMVRQLFGGLLNTELVEDLNKLQREHECRDSTKQEVSEMLSWRIGTQHDLLKGYKRKEIQAADVRSPPKDYDPQLLFRRQVDRMSKPERTEREEKIESTLKKICGPTKWYVCTPESHQQTMVNLALLVHIKEEFEKVESAWHGSLLPEGHVAFVNNYKFVLRTYRNGALVWPMTTKILTERGEGCRAWTFDLEVSELEFLFVFDKTSVLVHPLKMMSPVRMWLAHKSSGSGVTLTSHKAACSLESFHASTGFANLSEEILKRLCKDWAVPLPKSQKALAETKALRTALLLNKNPGLEAASVKAAVMKGDGNLEGEDEFDLEEVENILQDTTLANEKDQIMKLMKSSTKKKTEVQVSEAMQKCFEDVVENLSGTGGGTRTYDPVPAEIDRLLHASIPMGGKVYTDEDNGRWKIGFSTDEVHQQRSLSWTTAGGPAAGLAAVRQLWSSSELCSGEGMSEQAAKNEEAMIAAREPGPQKTFLFLK
ncbi:unnamed protein product [Symbiodinium sp. CCMP2592]|nr:unnamed protein product [Symbiodinium sp. CCMP2592]